MKVKQVEKFKYDRCESHCVDAETNERVLCLDPDIPGRVYVYLEGDDFASAAEQFARYGVLSKDDFPGDGRLAAVSFELDLPAMLENMLDLGFSDPERNLSEWLVMFQHCSHRLAEELVKRQGRDGPPPRSLKKG
jgi:hypothetical protein